MQAILQKLFLGVIQRDVAPHDEVSNMRKPVKFTSQFVFLFVVGSLLAANSTTSAKNIVETVKAAGKFSILVKAVTAAGLDKTLAEPGPYTVFAPTDAAFNALPPGTLEMLMKPENKDMLKQVLGYHTLFGRLTTRDLKDDKSAATTTNGQPVVLAKKAGGVMVNDAKIDQSDVPADNGVIHVIDKVLMPPKPVQPTT